ncbi:chromate resistance protein [Methylomonas sp. SURF-2]|uniref:Chromate resistance protein n=1 Tax=Methylomonas subterranea TaxID=2952225 RepID=A0ABT1TL49_9GAMM|nr:chromate resistance protein ChrB domain-containing protein [Methylomonas sp. SURF-2]MCQ8106199.1 chromate resistance protein [Methylomonas sp. SURF-2]
MDWILLIISLPTENTSLRMRVWRGLKAAGAAVLRDGVYLLPRRSPCREILAGIAQDIVKVGGSARILTVEEPVDVNFRSLFERGADFAVLVEEVALLRQSLSANHAGDAQKQCRKLRKQFAQLQAIDFFPGQAQAQAERALSLLERDIARALSADEPQAMDVDILQLEIADYQGRRWATRRRPKVDRLASAWLIRRFIDSGAVFLWLESPADCPADAIGFDFDGAAFSHVGALVSFEVLLASFAIEQPALQRIGGLVHFLDVGGIQPAEAIGVESVLNGLLGSVGDDDALLNLASAVFDGLYTAFKTQITGDNRV